MCGEDRKLKEIQKKSPVFISANKKLEKIKSLPFYKPDGYQKLP
jgi:hypothetical protein